jgi:hypothetical protein
MSVPGVYRAINAVAGELARLGIAKTHVNTQDQYLYRSIDDVLNRLGPLLAQHRLCVLPRVLERTSVDRQSVASLLLVSVTLRVAFDFVSVDDASIHTVEAFGEALDEGDKGTAKAMSSAYKAAVLQAFCIPVCGTEDPDQRTHKLARKTHDAEPVGGWEQWAGDITRIIESCESTEALARVQTTNRGQLLALSRERADLYAHLGASFANSQAKLAKASPYKAQANVKERKLRAPARTKRTGPQSLEPNHVADHAPA